MTRALVVLLAFAAIVLAACNEGSDYLLDEEPEATGTPPFYQRTPPATPTPLPSPTPAAGECGDTYIVQAGDVPFTIAQKCGVDVDDLLELNGIADPTKVRVGQELRIPRREAEQ